MGGEKIILLADFLGSRSSIIVANLGSSTFLLCGLSR